jgi:haloalkane dehalogenase
MMCAKPRARQEDGMGMVVALVSLAAAIIAIPALALAAFLIDTWACKARYARWRARGGARPVVRTQDERFEGLPGYPFAPNYIELDGLRMHYVDEGPRGAAPILLLHGEPTWSYLYRKMIPALAAAGHRVIAPDLIGFGKSDKLARQCDYTYQMHVDMMDAFVKALDLRGITLFCQDWGGLIGLRAALDLDDRFARIVASNTGIPGKAPRGKFQPVTDLRSKHGPRGFLQWFFYSQFAPDFQVGKIIQMASRTKLTPEEIAAYDAPFATRRHKAGARKFPRLVPSELAKSAEAWERYARWDKPFLTAFSSGDPITRGIDRVMQRVIPGAQGQPHTIVRGAGHFIQEDKGEELAEIVLKFIAAAPQESTEN